MTRPHRPALTRAQVAAELGETLDWFYRNRKRLERDHGFPPALPGTNGRKWDLKAINAWKDAQMPDHLKRDREPMQIVDLKLVDPEAYAEDLDNRALALARGDREGKPQ